MRIRIWGARGSLPRPAPGILRYGGNTACVEVRAEDGTLVVLDGGTGIYGLGQALAGEKTPLREGHLLLTHTHWDHIQGVPFFAPLFASGTSWHVYAPGFRGGKLRKILSAALSYSYFPVSLDELGAAVTCHDLTEGIFDIGPLRVLARYANHTTITLGYRLEGRGVSVVYVPDHEPNALRGGGEPFHREDQGHVDFIAGADLLFHDAQYTMEEYGKRLGWGHSPVERVVDDAVLGGVKRLALFHHDPMREDGAMDLFVREARCRARRSGRATEVFAAAEGQTLRLYEGTNGPSATRPPRGPAFPTRLANVVMVVGTEDERLARLQAAMPSDDFQVTLASDEETFRRSVDSQPSDLVLVTQSGEAGLGACRAVRSHPDASVRQQPVVVYAEETLTDEIVRRWYAAGATDCLPGNASPAQLRARVCAWLLRTAAA